MSFTITRPEVLAAPAGNLQAIGAVVDAGAPAVATHEMSVKALGTGGGSYPVTEATNAVTAR